MYFLRGIWGFAAAAVAVAAAAPSAIAQENMDIFACQFAGGGPSEPLGDREGHALRVTEFSCLATSGALTGGVLTGSSIYELDKGTGVLLSGNGVIRKPGVTAVAVLKDAKLSPIIVDGKVTGVATSGHGNYVMATGSWAPLVGKSFTMSSKPTSPGLFEMDITGE